MDNFVKVLTGFFLVVGLSGCGGGSGDPKNSQPASVPDTPPPIKVMNCSEKTFIQADFGQEIIDPSCSAENKVSVSFRRYVDVSTENIDMDIRINATQPVFSQSFYLAYDPAVLQYIGYEPGNFFGTSAESGVAVAVMKSDEGAAGGVFFGCNHLPGKSVVVVGASRKGYHVPGVSGNNLAVRLRFKIAGSGETSIAFAQAMLLEKAANPADPVANLVKEIDSCWPKNIKIQI